MPFKKAVRTAQPLRIAIIAGPGGGKTYTALQWMHELVGNGFAVVDTEHGKSQLYLGGKNGWEFDIDTPMDDYDPGKLARTIREAAAAGYKGIVIDSLSHYWSGPGGSIDLSEKLQVGTNKFSGWSKVKEREQDMLGALLAYPGHVIVTARAKTERIEGEVNGKKKLIEVVTKADAREGIAFEFDLVVEMAARNNHMEVMKSRFGEALPMDFTTDRPGGDVIRGVARFLADAASAKSAQEYADEARSATKLSQIQELRAEVARRGLKAAGVVDPAGEAVALDKLLIEFGTPLYEAEQAAQRAAS